MANHKFDAQRGEVRRVHPPLPRAGEAECAVCGYPAHPLPPDQDSRHSLGQAYRHDGRFVLCRTLGFWSVNTKLTGVLI